jgi:hypothetical protein
MTEQQSKIQQIIDIVQMPPIADIKQIPIQKTSYRWQPRWSTFSRSNEPGEEKYTWS